MRVQRRSSVRRHARGDQGARRDHVGRGPARAASRTSTRIRRTRPPDRLRGRHHGRDRAPPRRARRGWCSTTGRTWSVARARRLRHRHERARGDQRAQGSDPAVGRRTSSTPRRSRCARQRRAARCSSSAASAVGTLNQTYAHDILRTDARRSERLYEGNEEPYIDLEQRPHRRGAARQHHRGSLRLHRRAPDAEVPARTTSRAAPT